jgi:predicted Zn-dependent protease
VSIEPRNVPAHMLLIDLARQTGDTTLAGQRIVNALGANPGEKELLLAKAVLEADENNLPLAREIVEQIVASNPRYIPALSLLVNLGLRSNDVASAERRNAEMLAVDPNNETARLAQAAILMAKGQPSEALTSAEAYCQTEAGRKSVDCYLTLARLYLHAKRFDDAERAINEGQRLAPGNQSVQMTRLEWLAVQNRYLLQARRTCPVCGKWLRRCWQRQASLRTSRRR